MSFKCKKGEKISIRRVHILSSEEIAVVSDYMQGLVYCWCNTKPHEYFHAKDLLGGLNTNWKDTPVEILYKKYKDAGKTHEQAHPLAGRAAGMILKAVLKRDCREFEIKKGYTLSYRWTGKTNHKQ